MDFLDRSLAIGAQAFGAIIPLLIVLQAVQPGERSLRTCSGGGAYGWSC